MSTPNQARIEFGTAGANIAGNIDVLLPQLALRGAEVATAGNEIHEKVRHLREISLEFLRSTAETIQEVEFDKIAKGIKALLPQLTGHGADVDSVVNAINGYCNQLATLYAQHMHLVDENAPIVPGFPLVNNGIGSGSFETGTAVVTSGKIDPKFDPNPKPVGDGVATEVVAPVEPLKVEIV